MMKRALIMLTMAMTILSCLLVAQTATAPTREQKVVVVPSDKDWTDTRYELKPGDKVTIKASGRIYFDERADSAVGANGLNGDYQTLRPEDYAACADPLPKENHGCLIAKINTEIFKLGSDLTFSGKEGKLQLGINDCTFTGKLGNSGVFGVNIKIERDAIAAKK